MTDQPAFEITDATGERVYLRPAIVNFHNPTRAVAMETETSRPVYFAVDQLEDTIAGMRDTRRQAAALPLDAAGVRDAARQAGGQPARPPMDPAAILGIAPDWQATAQPATEVAPLAIPRGAAETVHAVLGDLLRPLDARRTANQPDPTIADDPVRLRWGLNDVMWGDDDTVTVCMSGPGPDYLPYWLELDPERANVLRQDLAGPEPEPQDHPGAELYTQLRKAGLDHDATNQLIYAHAAMAVRQHEALNDAAPAVGRQDATQPTTDETETDVTWSVVFRTDTGDTWQEWSKGWRDTADAVRSGETVASIATVAEVRFVRTTTTRERFSLHQLAAGAES